MQESAAAKRVTLRLGTARQQKCGDQWTGSFGCWSVQVRGPTAYGNLLEGGAGKRISQDGSRCSGLDDRIRRAGGAKVVDGRGSTGELVGAW